MPALRTTILAAVALSALATTLQGGDAHADVVPSRPFALNGSFRMPGPGGQVTLLPATLGGVLSGAGVICLSGSSGVAPQCQVRLDMTGGGTVTIAGLRATPPNLPTRGTCYLTVHSFAEAAAIMTLAKSGSSNQVVCGDTSVELRQSSEYVQVMIDATNVTASQVYQL